MPRNLFGLHSDYLHVRAEEMKDFSIKLSSPSLKSCYLSGNVSFKVNQVTSSTNFTIEMNCSEMKYDPDQPCE